MATYDVHLFDNGATIYTVGATREPRVFMVEEFPPAEGGGSTLVYRMRGYDTDIPSIVFWSAPIVDSTAAYYGGVGPVTGIVVQKVIGT